MGDTPRRSAARRWSRAARVGPVLMLLMAAAPAAADTPQPTITIEGEASRDVVPDIARLALGIEAERPTAAAATADVAAAAQAVTAQLRQEGIPDADVTTTALVLLPVEPDDRSRPADQPRGPRPVRAAMTFRIVVKPAGRAGALASHLVDKGATTIQGFETASSAEAGTLDALRVEAMHDALHKAEVYVGALGLHLGRVLDITPVGAPGPRPMMRALAGAAATLPTMTGTVTLQTAVSVRWEIVP